MKISHEPPAIAICRFDPNVQSDEQYGSNRFDAKDSHFPSDLPSSNDQNDKFP